MVNPAKRMRGLQPLFNIRHGLGAAVLPPAPAPRLASVRLQYPRKEWSKKIAGPRFFVKENLPRLKFHNPALPIKVEDNAAMILSLTFESPDPKLLGQLEPRIADIKKIQQKPQSTEGASTDTKKAPQSPTPAPEAVTYTRDVSLKLDTGEPLSNTSIWEWFQRTTKCTDVAVPPEEQEAMDQLLEFQRKAAVDRVRVKAGWDAMKKEQEDLKRAREAADRLTSEV